MLAVGGAAAVAAQEYLAAGAERVRDEIRGRADCWQASLRGAAVHLGASEQVLPRDP